MQSAQTQMDTGFRSLASVWGRMAGAQGTHSATLLAVGRTVHLLLDVSHRKDLTHSPLPSYLPEVCVHLLQMVTVN